MGDPPAQSLAANLPTDLAADRLTHLPAYLSTYLPTKFTCLPTSLLAYRFVFLLTYPQAVAFMPAYLVRLPSSTYVPACSRPYLVKAVAFQSIEPRRSSWRLDRSRRVEGHRNGERRSK